MSEFPSVVQDVWIMRRLRKPDLYVGVTNGEGRKGLLRGYLLAKGLADVVVGHRGAHATETWGEFFERLYGEPLGDVISE